MQTLEERLLREHFPTEEAYAAAIARLDGGEPLAYILGEWYFYNEVYTVTPDVLIPRQDTEILVEQAIRLMPPGGRFLDLCTGSGCVAISVLANRPDLTAAAADLSESALHIAAENARRNGVADRLTLYRCDVLTGTGDIPGTFDAILSNPPYIDTAVIPTLSDTVLREPRMALDGGADGMDFYRAILRHFPKKLNESGIFLFEIGYDQKEKITSLAAPLPCKIIRDYGGNDRVAILPSR